MYFFFQAEDGIRDGRVTGVQTCALPISIARPSCAARRRTWDERRRSPNAGGGAGSGAGRRLRSEERRVGKEWRAGWVWGVYTDSRVMLGVQRDEGAQVV